MFAADCEQDFGKIAGRGVIAIGKGQIQILKPEDLTQVALKDY